MHAKQENPEVASGTVLAVGRKRRLLFVDDEPAILEGLRSVLRAQRREWDTSFALGGPAGLEEVRKSSFDVVVTDMRMPVLDGAALLVKVKELQPGAVRLVLSGQTDAETAMKTVLTAHQFLSKPCDVTLLRGVVRRTCDLNELLGSEELRSLVGDVSSLPVAPKSYLAISRTLADPKSSVSDVARIVELEPALCAKVLQVVNSAFFGLARAVSSVGQATNLLGTLTLRNLAVAMESVAACRATRTLNDKQFIAYQTNAVLAGLLGRHWYQSDRHKADAAFAAGMLRDIGHFILAGNGRVVGDAEHARHPAVSAHLLGLWGVPHTIMEAVAFHENPGAVEHAALELVDIVHLADHVATELAPSPFQREKAELDYARFAALGVTRDKIDTWRLEATRLTEQAREMLAL